MRAPGGEGETWPRLRIGLVGPLPPPSGGMANQTLQLAALLRAQGCEVELVQVNAPYRPGWVAPLKGVRAFCRLLPYLARLWRCAGRVQLLHVMANSGWSWHLFAAPAIWIGWLRGRPVVLNYRGGEADAFLARAAAWVRPSMARAAVVIVPSGYLEMVFGKYGVPCRVVPNIIDLARFAPAPAPAPSRPAAITAPRILVARHLEPIYDNASALRAFALVLAHYPAASLVIAGDGPLRAALEGLARELGVAGRVRFTGRLENADMAALYRDADLMLNPSTVDNMPNSVLEALASALPVVSTDVGGLPFLARDGVSALLVPAASPEAMAAAMLRLIRQPALAAALREAGLRQVERYTWRAVRPVLLDVYRQALDFMP